MDVTERVGVKSRAAARGRARVRVKVRVRMRVGVRVRVGAPYFQPCTLAAPAPRPHRHDFPAQYATQHTPNTRHKTHSTRAVGCLDVTVLL